MVLKHLGLPTVSILVALLVPSPAAASPITITFTAFPAEDDPVNVIPSIGYFTFDSGLIPDGGGYLQDLSSAGLPVSEIQFRWGGTDWTTANAAVGELQFNWNGDVSGFGFGGKSFGVWGMLIGPAEHVVDDFHFTAFDSQGTTTGGGIYTNAGIAGYLQGFMEADLARSEIPEPGTMFLLGGGLGCILYLRRRRAT